MVDLADVEIVRDRLRCPGCRQLRPALYIGPDDQLRCAYCSAQHARTHAAAPRPKESPRAQH